MTERKHVFFSGYHCSPRSTKDTRGLRGIHRVWPHSVFAVQPKTVPPPPAISHYSNCRWKPFYRFHGNLYPALALHEIYSEIRGYFFPFVNLSQGQFKKKSTQYQTAFAAYLCIADVPGGIS